LLRRASPIVTPDTNSPNAGSESSKNGAEISWRRLPKR
jgi:hypothetical protein